MQDWPIHASVVRDSGLDVSSWLLALYKVHFGISYVRFGGGNVVPDEGFGYVWEIHASVDHDRGLEMSPWHLALYKDHFDISYVRFFTLVKLQLGRLPELILLDSFTQAPSAVWQKH